MIPGGKASRHLFALTVDECLFVWFSNLIVALCVVVCLMLQRVPLHVRVSPETRQRLQLLRTQRHLNVGSWLRALIDEALDREFGPAPTDATELVAPGEAAHPEPSLDGPRPG